LLYLRAYSGLKTGVCALYFSIKLRAATPP